MMRVSEVALNFLNRGHLFTGHSGWKTLVSALPPSLLRSYGAASKSIKQGKQWVTHTTTKASPSPNPVPKV